MNALSRNVGAPAVALARNLVDFVDEHDAVVFRAVDRFGLHRVVVHQLGGLLFEGDLHRLFYGNLALLFLVLEHVAEDAADTDRRAAGNELHGLRNVAHFHFHDEIVISSLSQPV